jgi:hypothetical protein
MFKLISNILNDLFYPNSTSLAYPNMDKINKSNSSYFCNFHDMKLIVESHSDDYTFEHIHVYLLKSEKGNIYSKLLHEIALSYAQPSILVKNGNAIPPEDDYVLSEEAYKKKLEEVSKWNQLEGEIGNYLSEKLKDFRANSKRLTATRETKVS